MAVIRYMQKFAKMDHLDFWNIKAGPKLISLLPACACLGCLSYKQHFITVMYVSACLHMSVCVCVCVCGTFLTKLYTGTIHMILAVILFHSVSLCMLSSVLIVGADVVVVVVVVVVVLGFGQVYKLGKYCQVPWDHS